MNYTDDVFNERLANDPFLKKLIGLQNKQAQEMFQETLQDLGKRLYETTEENCWPALNKCIDTNAMFIAPRGRSKSELKCKLNMIYGTFALSESDRETYIDYIDYTAYFQTMRKKDFDMKKVIFNDPATIVIWGDGSKTIVKVQNGEKFDPEKGLAMAISKKVLGNKGNYYNSFKKWISDGLNDTSSKEEKEEN